MAGDYCPRDCGCSTGCRLIDARAGAELAPRAVAAIADRLDGLIGSEALATYHGQDGGEWDAVRSVQLTVRRRLTGAGYMRRDAMPPDVFVDLLRKVVGAECEPDPIAWYVREASRAVVDRRRARQAARRVRLARRHGFPTFYAYRSWRAREEGFRSLWELRKARGWR